MSRGGIRVHNKPCIVQRDRTILLETAHADAEAAREQLAQYADLIKSPASFHTYRLTPLSLWNAAAGGMSAEAICSSLQSLSRWDVPAALLEEVRQLVGRYGQLSLLPHPTLERALLLSSNEEALMQELTSHRSLREIGVRLISPKEAEVPSDRRGVLKQEMTRLGYPVLDHAGYMDGQYLNILWRGEKSGSWRLEDSNGGSNDQRFVLRDYQQKAAESFRDIGGEGGNGVLVLPCGAGKTVIGIAAMRELQCETLILTSNTTSVRQWIAELMQKTTLSVDEIGEYSGQRKQVRPVTVATYHILTHRQGKGEEQHMKLFNERRWGLIIYDEVHLLPAPVFRATADIQATRRLGLTATLVREDGRESDVFSLIGPKRYEMPWKRLEAQGWIASVTCTEIKVPLPDEIREACETANKREQYRLAAENPSKLDVIRQLVDVHKDAQTLIIGQYLDQLHAISRELQAPLITGQMTQDQRNEWYNAFREGNIRVLVVSKVANFAVDLPDASVAIEVSGSYGSRQEEAQRLGRLLRPKSGENRAYFYALVTEDSREEIFAIRRQLFLIEQGYEYHAIHAKQPAASLDLIAMRNPRSYQHPDGKEVSWR
ncbi:DEAD/DEAH box helicase [Paenibacillus lautus]|uniref:DNA repair helicase XPB n=1 Tax=Paenibacillus lautus TaxID=1401 RepID=UPI00203B3716|nr:DNA repair helicase XPB [Paenibacillus lautus]MCM3256540.1 DEAD/DEAH box helicase [Paenibacillus lautus]